ncbi:MAG: ABC transporter ATP-binding protein [Bacteroidales bacterium]|jgi:ABC-2 type transport system ATP-binding protein|nr:ABC transporter ATP-binding protein [Bacteroidales bacterium]
MEIIIVKDLVMRFGSFTANDRLTFSVAKGEIFGFLGANGAGKTTTMKVLCGLLKPTSGSVVVAGYDVALHPEKVKRNIGYMSQKFSLNDDLTVTENILVYGTIYGLGRAEIGKRTDAMLERLELTQVRKRLVKTLSLGWKQKLAFSVATLHRPSIVFLDEPTSGVDPVTRRRFWELIYEAAENDITVFVTTHYMDEAEYCDRVSIMNRGQIIALDTPQRLKQAHGVESINELFVRMVR